MINFEAIANELIEYDAPGLAKEEASELVEHWVRENAARDAKWKILAVECGFVIALDPYTYIIGVQDLIAADAGGIFGGEWKSTKGPSKWWSESKWLEEIGNGSQLAVYALAQAKGTYYEKGGAPEGIVLGNPSPRIRVRACVKSSPPECWPHDPSEGVFMFGEKDLKAVEDALRAKAETIRALRKSELTPWQLPGRQCYPFNRTCPMLEEYCKPRAYLTPKNVFDPSDPAAMLALPHIPADVNDPNVVILSASSYATASECLELYRNVSGATVEKEESMALSVGSVFHVGCASFYRQLKSLQNIS